RQDVVEGRSLDQLHHEVLAPPFGQPGVDFGQRVVPQPQQHVGLALEERARLVALVRRDGVEVELLDSPHLTPLARIAGEPQGADGAFAKQALDLIAASQQRARAQARHLFPPPRQSAWTPSGLDRTPPLVRWLWDFNTFRIGGSPIPVNPRRT